MGIGLKVVKMLKIHCPHCGAEYTLNVTNEMLEEAAKSPTGLAGVAIPSGDHVLVVYIDSMGGERGTRVFKTAAAYCM